MGPSHTNALGESAKVIADLINGVYPVIMGLEFGIVDVRDVARAHILAFTTPAANGRYLCFEYKQTMQQLVDFISQNYPQFSSKLPTTNASCGPGNALMKVAASFQEAGVRDYLQKNLGVSLHFSNAKIQKDLGMTWIPINKTLGDTIVDLEKYGHISSNPKKSSKK